MKTMESVMANAIKKWCGNPPSLCDICKNAIITAFIDGATKMGPWACMCPKCHASNGIGIGPGMGQRYQAVNTHMEIGGTGIEWHKIAG